MKTEMPHTIVNAELRNAQCPGTFEMPSARRRKTLGPDDYAKLLFEPSVAGLCPERMWVRITERTRGGRYRGVLENEPLQLPDIELGDIVEFGPEHVIECVMKPS